MSTEGWLAAGFGGVFVLLLFATAIWLIASERQVPDTAQWMLRVIMALAGAGCGAGCGRQKPRRTLTPTRHARPPAC